MTLYQTSFTYTIIDTPLSEPHFIITEDDLAPELVPQAQPQPQQSIQQRMMLVLTLALLAIVAFTLFVGPYMHKNDAVASDTAVSPPSSVNGPSISAGVAPAKTGSISAVFSPA